MSIWNNPPRRLITALQRLTRHPREHQEGEVDEITIERVEAVLGTAKAVIKGQIVPVTGVDPEVRAGQLVHVANQDGRPVAILAHSARRAKFPSALSVVGGPVIEELFIATNLDVGAQDIFFRNQDQVTPLNLTSLLRIVGVTPQNTVQWAFDNSRFLVYEDTALASRPIHIVKLNRRNKVAYELGVTAKATLETTQDLSSKSGVDDRGLVNSGIVTTVNFQKSVGLGSTTPVPSANLGFGLTSVSFSFTGPLSGDQGFTSDTSEWTIFPAGNNPKFIHNNVTSPAPDPDLSQPVAMALGVVVGDAAPDGTAFPGNTTLTFLIQAFTPDLGFVRSNTAVITTPAPGPSPNSRFKINLTWTNPAGRPATFFSVITVGGPSLSRIASGSGVQPLSIVITSTPRQVLLDERGHLLVTYHVVGNDQANVRTLTSTMMVDVTSGALLFGPPLQGAIPVSPSSAIRLRTLKIHDVKDGLPLAATELVATVGSTLTGNFLAGLLGTTVGGYSSLGSLTLTSVSIIGTSLRADANRRHVVWATSAQVLMAAFDGTTGAISAPATVGSTAEDIAAFFASGGLGPNEYRRLRLLNIDFLYDSVNSTATLFFVRAWDYSNPATITLVNPAQLVLGNTTPSQKDGALAAVGSMKKLPTTVGDYPESPTGPFTIERFMAWQVVNDPNVLGPLGRSITKGLSGGEI